MGRIKKIHNDVELDRFHLKDVERLLAFNITKKRIVDLCNEEWKEDPFEKEVNYSSYHRALDGQEVWIGVVQQLEGLLETQTARPAKYLPQDDPSEDLATWMAQFAKATWWHKALKLNMPLNTLNSWFSGRVLKTRPELIEKVNTWWAKLQKAVAEAERYSDAKERDNNRQREYSHEVNTWDTWCKDLLEDGVSIDDLRQRFVEECLFADLNHLRLIDLADPQSPIYRAVSDNKRERLRRSWREQEFDSLRKAGFPKAMSRIPPDFNVEPHIRENRWGDRRSEESPKDLNAHLYGKQYRSRCVRYWDAEKRCVGVQSEIVEVSVDGHWRDATEAEKKGWESGIFYWEQALIETGDTRNSYTRDLDEAKFKVRIARRAYDKGSWDVDNEAALASAERTAERVLQQARDNTHGQYD